jgi:hypothetical protein
MYEHLMNQHRTSNRRRWLQFSLRTLLVAMLVAAAYFGGRTPALRELQATRERMAATERRAADAMIQAQEAREVARMRMLDAEVNRLQFEHAAKELEMRLIKAEAERAVAEKKMRDAESRLEKQAAAADSAP